MMRLLPFLLPLLMVTLPGAALAQGLPALTMTETEGGTTYSLSLQIVALMTALTVLPSIVLGMTAFTRIIIVLSILRQALGTQQTPPNQVLVALAMFLTFFIMQPTFALIESITTSVPVLVMDSWVGFNFANYEMLEFPNFYFISNNTPKFFSDEMKAFRKAFYEKYLSYPSLNSILGYELTYWLSTNAKSNLGFDLRSGLDLGAFRSGKLTWGFNFRNAKNNTYVPVFKFEAGELIPLN